MNLVVPTLKMAGSLLRYKIGCPRPFFMSYQITLRCNRRCMFCNAWKVKNPEELDTEKAKKIVSELGDIGVNILGITGGEPLIRIDLEEIALQASRQGITIGVNFVLNNVNYREFVPFCNWIKDLGVVVTAFPVAGEDNFVSTFSIPPDEVDDFVSDVLKEKTTNPFLGLSQKVIEFLPKFVKGEMPHICDAGRLYMGVSPIGELRICPIGPNSPDWKVGSLVTSSAKELLETNRFREVLEARKNCAPCLAGCTTPYSLLFRSSMKDLTKEVLAYYKVMRNKDRNQSEHFFDVYSD